MIFWVVIPIAFVLMTLWWRRASILTWTMAWWLVIFTWFQFGFATPIPQSVIWLYMGIVTLALLLYVTADEKRFREFKEPLIRFVTSRKYTIPLVLLVIGIPGLVAANVYLKMTAPVRAPFFSRTVHPANPDRIEVHDRSFDLNTLDNPLRPLEETNPEAFRSHVENGRRVYYQNCFYCHGDNTRGTGQFAHALNPIPTNLPENIPLLQEGYLFWRIAKGAPGLPEAGGPWESVMPAWENFLTEEEMWEVILFLYDFSNTRPRAREDVIEE
ncbi:MAG TPA: cytochrome c [Acidobacteriota bacterium]|nr:cytochrome c [Acidobacteriota bacterium]